jgi:hypothetical protein
VEQPHGLGERESAAILDEGLLPVCRSGVTAGVDKLLEFTIRDLVLVDPVVPKLVFRMRTHVRHAEVERATCGADHSLGHAVDSIEHDVKGIPRPIEKSFDRLVAVLPRAPARKETWKTDVRTGDGPKCSVSGVPKPVTGSSAPGGSVTMSTVRAVARHSFSSCGSPGMERSASPIKR